jgi:hypothetical protein
MLTRGDQQRDDMLGETCGPVCRVEAIFMLICISLHEGYEVFLLDFVAAYLNTTMPDEVKCKWLMLDRQVAKILMQRASSH